jgi:hypothetical protein
MTFRQRAGIALMARGQLVVATLAKWVIGREGCTSELVREVVRRAQIYTAEMPANAARVGLAREGLQLQDAIAQASPKEEEPERI